MAWLKHDGSDREAWFRAHDGGISASMICKAMTPAGRVAVMHDLLNPREVDTGNDRMRAYMDHGHRREEEFINGWIESRFGIPHNVGLWGHDGNRRHLATPDGIDHAGGRLAEFKTATKPLGPTIPRAHRDQMQWQLWVMEAEACLYVHEQHLDFVPVNMPITRWVERDEERIGQLVSVANALLFELDMHQIGGF